jgi:hemolysin III
MTTSDAKYTATYITEEIFSSITHGLGAIAAIVGLIVGLVALRPHATFMAGFIVYCSCLILLMTMSCLYHALSFTRAKGVFRVFDHSGIFLLIAGSFTPLTMQLYSGWAAGLLLALFWSLAITGIIFKAALPRMLKKLSMTIYITMGWLALLFIPKLHELPGNITLLVLLGGILYTSGAALLAIKRPFIHVAWHVFVLAAASVHFIAISMII